MIFFIRKLHFLLRFKILNDNFSHLTVPNSPKNKYHHFSIPNKAVDKYNNKPLMGNRVQLEKVLEHPNLDKIRKDLKVKRESEMRARIVDKKIIVVDYENRIKKESGITKNLAKKLRVVL